MEPECARGEAHLALHIGARCPCFCASRIPVAFVVEKLRSKLAVTAQAHEIDNDSRAAYDELLDRARARFGWPDYRTEPVSTAADDQRT